MICDISVKQPKLEAEECFSIIVHQIANLFILIPKYFFKQPLPCTAPTTNYTCPFFISLKRKYFLMNGVWHFASQWSYRYE